MNLKEIKLKLEKLNQRKCWNSDPEFKISDYAAGNIDDAYQGGFEDGRADLAWEILNELDNLTDNIDHPDHKYNQ